MTSFSERHEYRPDRSRMYQFEEMDERLRNAIWNFLRVRHFAYELVPNVLDQVRDVWTEVLGRRFDELSNWEGDAIGQVWSWYSSASWNEVYDLLEYLLSKRPLTNYVNDLNATLIREGAAYRFIGSVIAPITNESELVEVEDVLHHRGTFEVASQHMRQAVNHLSDRSSPDARNIIKEAISAVESAAKVASGDPKADVEKALKKLEMHPQLEQAWKNMYNWTSDEGGVRHGKEEISQVGLAEARYMVVACSAFVNYLISKSSEGDSR